jgi:hypothetical protein
MLGLQFNRMQIRTAINQFFTWDPKENPDLAAVHKAMGLSGTEPIMNDKHPVVCAARLKNPGEPFILCPVKKSEVSSVLGGDDPVLKQFEGMLGEVLLALGVCETVCLLCSLHLKLCFWRACRSLFSSFSEPVS